jgi:hypothetical protein
MLGKLLNSTSNPDLNTRSSDIPIPTQNPNPFYNKKNDEISAATATLADPKKIEPMADTQKKPMPHRYGDFERHIYESTTDKPAKSDVKEMKMACSYRERTKSYMCPDSDDEN